MLRIYLAIMVAAVTVLPAFADDWQRERRRDRNQDRYRNNDRYNDSYRDRDYNYGSRNRRSGNSSIVTRTVQDLRVAASRNRVDSHEREHFERALEDLNRFQYNWSRGGNFDRDRLDGAIEHLNDLSRADQIHPRDRAMLSRDLYALREFRSSRGGSGW